MLGKEQPLGAIDRTKMNVKGSSIAYGHPFAATGARILATLAKILEENGGGRGLISICTAGGMGVCAILERPREAAVHSEAPTTSEPAATEAPAAPEPAAAEPPAQPVHIETPAAPEAPVHDETAAAPDPAPQAGL